MFLPPKREKIHAYNTNYICLARTFTLGKKSNNSFETIFTLHTMTFTFEHFDLKRLNLYSITVLWIWVTGILAANVVLYIHNLVHYTVGEIIYLVVLLSLLIATVCVGTPSGDSDYWSFLDDPVLITVCTLCLVIFAASLIYTVLVPIPDPLPACSVHNWFLPTGTNFK